MLTRTSQPVPLSGSVVLCAGARVKGVRKSAVPFDTLGKSLDEARIARASEAIRAAAHREASDTAAKALMAAAERIERAIDRAEEALSVDAVELGVEIARQILKIEIEAGNYDLERIVRATLGASDVKRGRCIVYLHPSDADLLKDVVFREETEIRPDADVARGSVNVETPRGLLVRDASAALEEIREQLLEDLV